MVVIRLNFQFSYVIFLNTFCFACFLCFITFVTFPILFNFSTIWSFIFLHLFWVFLLILCFYFCKKFKHNHIDPILCEINLRGVLTTIYKVICAFASSKTCTIKFCTSVSILVYVEKFYLSHFSLAKTTY